MKKVLVCPLDWGLGHATRSIPLVRELMAQGASVSLASAGSAGRLLRSEFPSLAYFELPEYSPRYPSDGGMVIEMAVQLPKFLRTIRQEHQTVRDLVTKNGFDIVVSDHRYGCHTANAKTIFLTHQPDITIGGRWSFLESYVSRHAHRYIRKFNEVWIPDQQGSGLTIPFGTGGPGLKHVGWLSRFRRGRVSTSQYLAIGIVSGPEPQRSLFSKLLLSELQKLDGPTLLVRGDPESEFHSLEGNVNVYNHLDTAALEEAIRCSETVVSRSGYSSVMDMLVMGKKAIFVPTPQQPEQLLLARCLEEMGVACSVQQDEFDLLLVLERAKSFKGFASFDVEEGLLQNAVKELLS